MTSSSSSGSLQAGLPVGGMTMLNKNTIETQFKKKKKKRNSKASGGFLEKNQRERST